jgi:hypothetical protein
MAAGPERPLPDSVFAIIIVVLMALALLPRCVPDIVTRVVAVSRAVVTGQGSRIPR